MVEKEGVGREEATPMGLSEEGTRDHWRGEEE